MRVGRNSRSTRPARGGSSAARGSCGVRDRPVFPRPGPIGDPSPREGGNSVGPVTGSANGQGDRTTFVVIPAGRAADRRRRPTLRAPGTPLKPPGAPLGSEAATRLAITKSASAFPAEDGAEGLRPFDALFPAKLGDPVQGEAVAEGRGVRGGARRG